MTTRMLRLLPCLAALLLFILLPVAPMLASPPAGPVQPHVAKIKPAAVPITVRAPLLVPSKYPTIQAAVNASQDGDTVLVADGPFSGSGNRDIDLLGKSITVTSQNGPTKTIIDCGGYASTDGSGNHRGFYIHSGEKNATISGFTVKNGYETYISSITDSGNDSYDGGGIYAVSNGGTITLTNCTVSGNITSYNSVDYVGDGGGGGGGVYSATYNGGTITLTNCTVSGNTATENAGLDGSAGAGGGIFNNQYDGTITLTNCTVSGNTATYFGGGVLNYSEAGGTITLTNCTVSGNTASYAGGGVYNESGYDTGTAGTITLTNCTVSGNAAGYAGGGVYNDSDSYMFTLINDIIYGDTGGEMLDDSGTATASFSDIQGGDPGTGNINADPQFVNAATGDLHLKSGSPCLGAGMPNGAPATDLDGNTRPNPPSIGAYDLTATAFTITAVKLGLPSFVENPKGTFYLSERVYLEGKGTGNISGRWLLGGTTYAHLPSKSVALSSQKWTEGGEFQIPWAYVKDTQLSLSFALDTPNTYTTQAITAWITGFRPDLNAWDFSNDLFPNLPFFPLTGQCLGMTSLARWYYVRNQPIPNWSLKQGYLKILRFQTEGNQWYKTHDLQRAFLEKDTSTALTTESERIKNRLKAFDPCVVCLNDAKNTNMAGHAVLATAGFYGQGLYDDVNGIEVSDARLLVFYDPNYEYSFPYTFSRLYVSGAGADTNITYLNHQDFFKDYDYIVEYTGQL